MLKRFPFRVLSGIQPTGVAHIGNYFGALANWVSLQRQDIGDLFFMVADLHAVTSAQDPTVLKNKCLETAATLLACGIDPVRSCVFIQSQVPFHAELGWLLGCITPLGFLDRMTQFKAKATKSGSESATLGLYSYPVLQAADILLYRATAVPVGADQKQHLELCRDIAAAFNRRFVSSNGDLFPLPEPSIISGGAGRIMSLSDPFKKMSKSDEQGGDVSRINLTDDADLIWKKIKRAKSDSNPIISYDEINRPELSNLLRIFAAAEGNGASPGDVCLRFTSGSGGTAAFKRSLADALIARVCPIGDEIKRYMKEPAIIEKFLLEGARRAAFVAEETQREVRKRMGLMDALLPGSRL